MNNAQILARRIGLCEGLFKVVEYSYRSGIMKNSLRELIGEMYYVCCGMGEEEIKDSLFVFHYDLDSLEGRIKAHEDLKSKWTYLMKTFNEGGY